jgi:RHS repeat-associated protein
MIQETGTNQHSSLYIYTDQSSYEPLARIDKRGNDPEKVMYFHTDLNGCPEELTDENGKILWECSFQLWGKRIHEIEHEPIKQNLRYQGQYLDRETGLHYNTFRYYDPDIGRFTQPDPIGLLGGFNLYQYAPNGLTWIDPWGLMPWNWNPNGMGHHLIPRNKANSIGLTELGTKRNTPTFFPDPYSPGMHEELHRAIKNDIGKIQGPWTGTADDLFHATSRNLDSVSYIKGDLKIPSTGEVLARNVTPKEAHAKLLKWFNNKQARKISGGKCG